MNYKALNKEFTKAVAAKLAEGFTICTQTMAGSQGEDAKVNFTDDAGNHYSLYMDREHTYGGYRDPNTRRNMFDKVVILFVRSNELHGNYNRRDLTLWLGEKHCTLLEKKSFWIVGDGWFVESDEEAEAAARKRWERLKNDRDFSYKGTNPVAVTKATKETVCSLYKKTKKRNEKAIKPTDITGISLEHSQHGIHICLEGAFEHGVKGFWVNFKK